MLTETLESKHIFTLQIQKHFYKNILNSYQTSKIVILYF